LLKYKDKLCEKEKLLTESSTQRNDELNNLTNDFQNKLNTQYKLNSNLKKELEQTQLKLVSQETEVSKLTQLKTEQDSQLSEYNKEFSRITSRMSSMEDLMIKYT